MSGSLPRVLLRTPLGDIIAELFSDRAPISCADFLLRADDGRFAGAAFYRVVDAGTDPVDPPISVVQGGVLARDPLPGIAHEPTDRTGIAHRDGTLSIARAEPGTGSGASFFICIGDQPALDAGGGRQLDGMGFAAFGVVIEGMDVVRTIHSRPADGAAPAPFLVGQMLREAVPIQAVERIV